MPPRHPCPLADLPRSRDGNATIHVIVRNLSKHCPIAQPRSLPPDAIPRRTKSMPLYAWRPMASPRPVLLALCAGLWACASPPAAEKAAKPKPVAEAPEEPDVDLRTLLRLDERPFPLTVWTAHIISEEYFDKTRLDPRGQLVSALTHLGLHTPEFFATVAGDTATVTVGDTQREFPLADATTLAPPPTASPRSSRSPRPSSSSTPSHPQARVRRDQRPARPPRPTHDPPQPRRTHRPRHQDQGPVRRHRRRDPRGRAKHPQSLRSSPARPPTRAASRAATSCVQIDKQSTVNLRAADAQQLLRGPVDSQVTSRSAAANRPSRSR
jgi:carboxyl-terminal processing protease